MDVPALLQQLVGDFFLIFGREILREIWREFCIYFLDPQNKGSKIRGKFWSIFREKIRNSKKLFHAKFALQVCHTKNHGRPHQKIRFSAAPVMGRNFFGPGASGHKGQECPQEMRTEKFLFKLFLLP